MAKKKKKTKNFILKVIDGVEYKLLDGITDSLRPGGKDYIKYRDIRSMKRRTKNKEWRRVRNVKF